MTRRSQLVPRDRVPLLTQRGLAQPSPVELHDLRAEHLAADAGVLVGVGAAQLVIDVDGSDPVAKLPERVPETGRIGAARDEAANPTARRDEPVPADVLLDPRTQRRRVHAAIVPQPEALKRRAGG